MSNKIEEFIQIKAEVIKIPWDDDAQLDRLCRGRSYDQLKNGDIYIWSADARAVKGVHDYQNV